MKGVYIAKASEYTLVSNGKCISVFRNFRWIYDDPYREKFLIEQTFICPLELWKWQ